MTLTPETRARLRALAEAALTAECQVSPLAGGVLTHGPMGTEGGAGPLRSDLDAVEAWAALVAAADAATVLALLDALDAAERGRTAAEADADDCGARLGNAHHVAHTLGAVAGDALRTIALAAGLPEDARPDEVAQAVGDMRAELERQSAWNDGHLRRCRECNGARPDHEAGCHVGALLGSKS